MRGQSRSELEREDRLAAAFAEERQGVVRQIELGADSACDRSLRQRHRETAFGRVVDERAARGGFVEVADELRFRREVERRPAGRPISA